MFNDVYDVYDGIDAYDAYDVFDDLTRSKFNYFDVVQFYLKLEPIRNVRDLGYFRLAQILFLGLLRTKYCYDVIT
jgi:hypothetical protein